MVGDHDHPPTAADQAESTTTVFPEQPSPAAGEASPADPGDASPDEEEG
jgi:hypothetical protein